ncbi:MAG: TRAP transporter TatT component family protein [Woeseiaceae bacterium]|nr:TRAP transporter TatT component family protein [Woeseiaceae bacterium]
MLEARMTGIGMGAARGRAGQSGLVLVLLATLVLPGCSLLVSRAASSFGDNLTSAILNQDDPELVRAGMPSYILLLDSFLQGEDDNPAILAAAATMYASYGAVFATEPERASRLTRRARTYGLEAMCAAHAEACGWREMRYDAFVASLAGVDAKDADVLYAYGFATLAYLRSHADDWNTLAELPQAEALLERYLELAGADANPAAYTYLGVIQTLRPPSLGGEPEQAREHFERAIALTGGRDLGAKVEFARGYAKLLYDRELHDRLVAEVLEASPYAEGYTLMNVLAKEDALRLQAEADEYF